MATKLYKSDGVTQLIPETDDVSVTSTAIDSHNNVNSALRFLHEQQRVIADNIKDGQAVTSISMETHYILHESAANSDSIRLAESDPSNPLSWSYTYQRPTSEKPYAWKKVTFSAIGGTNAVFYELLNIYTAPDVTDTIYRSTSELSTISVELEKNNEGQIDLSAMQDDDYLPGPYQDAQKKESYWSRTPQAISAASPFVYVSTRKRNNGVWTAFGDPVLQARWAANSTLAIKYQITNNSNKPVVDRTSNEPTGWKNNITGDFTGYLWIITATKVGGELQSYDSNNIWTEPTLISIVK